MHTVIPIFETKVECLIFKAYYETVISEYNSRRGSKIRRNVLFCTLRFILCTATTKCARYGCLQEILYTHEYMNQETLLVALFFLFMIGAGIGFYIARMIFA